MQNEIHQFIQNILRYSKDYYSITKNNQIVFNDTITLNNHSTRLRDYEYFPYEIKSAKDFNIHNVGFSSLKNFPITCGSLLLSSCKNLENEIEIKSKVHYTTLASNTKIKSVIYHGKNLHIFNSVLCHELLELEKITIVNDALDVVLTLRDCYKITDFHQICLPPIIKCLSIAECNITTLEKLNVIITEDLSLNIPTLQNYKFINEINAGTILVDLSTTTKNIILALLQTNEIFLDASPNQRLENHYIEKNKKVCEIINSYTKKTKPHEHVMDCALELLECGYEEAAEL